MAVSTVVIFGVIAFLQIGIDLYPRVEFPTITIVTVLPGADPETVEITVTDPVEEAVSTISSIKHLRSTSADNVSQVVVEFDLDKDIDVAYQEIQARVSSIASDLPEDAEESVIEKFDVDSQPIMVVVLSSPTPGRNLMVIADDIVRERLQRIPNVGQVKIVGGRDRKIWIWLDQKQLTGHFVTVQDVIAALGREHVEVPGGRLQTGMQELTVKTKAEYDSVEELASIVVAHRSGAPIRIADLGRVEDGLEEERSRAELDGNSAIALLIRRQSGTNSIQVADAIKGELSKLRRELSSEAVNINIAKDSSVFVRHSVEEVQFHLLFGGGLAIAIVFVFLRNLRSTFISALVLPTSVIGTFIFMNALGFTQNIMTLLALSLAIGLLIDDAIVVQENIMRHIEEGKSPRQAAHDATHEITLAVLATSLAVIAVFVPVAFMKGIIGRFFFQFGLTVTFAIVISTLVSLTLDPMMSARILRAPVPGPIYTAIERVFSAMERVYGRLIVLSLQVRWMVIAMAIGACFAAGYLGQFLRSEFVPVEDQSEFNIKVKAPLGASLDTTDRILDDLQRRIASEPWIEYSFATIGSDQLERVNEGELYVKMTQKKDRLITQEQAMDQVRNKLQDIEGAKLSVEIVPRLSGGGRNWADVQLEIRGPDLDRLQEIANSVTEYLRSNDGYVDVDTSFESGKPEVGVYVKRDRAMEMGVSPLAIASTVRALIGGEDAGKFKAEGDRYDIGVRMREELRSIPDHIRSLNVRNDRGHLIVLENVVRIAEESGPVQIDRYNRSRKITILANLIREQKVLGEAVSEITEQLEGMDLPPGYTFGFAGTADTMGEAFFYLVFALFMSVVIVYIVLAAQFESFVHPFTIMLSLPLSVIGAIGALVLTGMTMSIYTMIGIILLMGLVTKNGILLVDYTNTLRRRDRMRRDEAVERAGMVRLRPILMTTCAVIFGMLPIAVGTGVGSESRAPMAVAVIGGLITSTLLTLIVVPTVYTLLDDLTSMVRRVLGLGPTVQEPRSFK